MDKVRKEIIKNAKAKAKEIISEANKEMKEILKSAEQTIEKRKAELEADEKKTLSFIEKTSEAEAKSEAKKAQLALKRDLLKNAFDKALEKLSDMPKQKKKKHLDLLKKKLGKGFSELYCSKKDVSLIKGKETNIKGGIIATNKQGDVRVDLSYETLLERVREKNIDKISQMLLG